MVWCPFPHTASPVSSVVLPACRGAFVRRIVAALCAVVSMSSCHSADAVDPSVPAGSVSASASTIALTADSVTIGQPLGISVVPRDAQGRPIGPNLAVVVSVTGTNASGTLSPVSYAAQDSSYRTEYTPITIGSGLTVRATVGGTPLETNRPIAVLPPLAVGTTFCSTVGAVCDFIGLRDVSLVTADSTTYTQEFYGSVPCAATGYPDHGFTNAPSAPYTHCRIGPIKYRTLANPMPGMSGLMATQVRVPLGDRGIPRPLIRSGVMPAAPQGDGSFRMTCRLATMDFFDPIVYPGQANASHLHMFFGNAGIAPGSTAASVTNGGSGTCQGGTVNRTGYWVPAVFDARTSEVIPPDFATIYYKTGYNVDPATIQEIPAGLAMIAGDKSNVGAVQTVNALEVAVWGCLNTPRQNTGAIPDCPVGDVVTLSISFPQCWDGVRLDSPDHQSHMAYPNYRNPPARSTCPASHPVMLPIITEIFRWPVASGMNPAYWRLTSDMYPVTARGGYTAHADWLYGWDTAVFRTIVTHCLRPGRDCGVALLGDGREVY